MARVLLDDEFVKRVPTPNQGQKLYFDLKLKGLVLRVTAGGSRTWVLSFRNTEGNQRRMTLGDATLMSCEAARRRVELHREKVDDGFDPMADRSERRAKAKEKKDAAAKAAAAEANAITLRKYVDERWRPEHIVKKRATTREGYEGLLRKWALPALGDKRLDKITLTDVEQLLNNITATGKKYASNRCRALLKAIFNSALRHGIIEKNPANGTQANPEEGRENFLKSNEIAAVLESLDEIQGSVQQQSARALKLLIFTGSRRSEVLHARWCDFDLEAGKWTKPSAHTKQKKVSHIYLSGPAVELLTEMKAEALAGAAARNEPIQELLFPAPRGLVGPQRELKKTWDSIRCMATVRLWEQEKDTFQGKLVRRLSESFKRRPTLEEVRAAAAKHKLPAGLTEVRTHDLRHSFASLLAAQNVDLLTIGKLLGHTQIKTTYRYAHLVDQSVKDAANKVGDALKSLTITK